MPRAEEAPSSRHRRDPRGCIDAAVRRHARFFGRTLAADSFLLQLLPLRGARSG